VHAALPVEPRLSGTRNPPSSRALESRDRSQDTGLPAAGRPYDRDRLGSDLER
jgi:hypothetical protein